MADASVPERRPVVLDALRTTLGRPPVWLVGFAIELLLAVPPALAFFTWMSGATEHRYAPRALFGNFDATFRFDHRADMGTLNASTGAMGAVLMLFAMLVGCFCAGGWLQVFLERTYGESLRRFFFGGARYFWRFFRLLFLTLLTLAAVSWILFGTPWQQIVLRWIMHVPPSDFANLETLRSEATVVTLRFVQAGLHLVLFGLVLTWGDYTRTRLALHDTSSALWAGLCTWYTILRHPVRTLRPMIGLVVIELAVVLGVGAYERSVDADILRGPGFLSIATLFTAGLLALLWRVVLRGARYHAAVQVSREVVTPIARPDPWKSSIGGPGGPRYPIESGEAGDEYAVSL